MTTQPQTQHLRVRFGTAAARNTQVPHVRHAVGPCVCTHRHNLSVHTEEHTAWRSIPPPQACSLFKTENKTPHPGIQLPPQKTKQNKKKTKITLLFIQPGSEQCMAETLYITLSTFTLQTEQNPNQHS